MDDTRLVFGIDLGTTYSCVAQVDKYDQAVVLKNFEGNNTTPSVVFFADENKVIVGQEAKEMMKVEPEKTVSFVKRSVSTDEDYNKPTRFPNGFDPTDISAFILKKIVQDANAASQNSEPIKKVVITCPAYFGAKERLRTKQAGELAGLEVLAIINEPTAAAIAYGMKVEEEKVIMVYDLGGGTFDVTIIKVSGGTITVIATGGDHHLGGMDWDRTLANYMLSVFNQEHNTSFTLESDESLKNQLLLLAEEKKKSLSGRDSVNATLDFQGKSSRINITRETFDMLTESLLEQTIDNINIVKKIAEEKNFNKIDDVILVGGSSKMPQVKIRIDQELGCDAKLTDPDECVAKGAAIYALNESFAQAMREYGDGERDEKPQNIGAATKVRAVNVTSMSYGLGFTDSQTNESLVQLLIKANTSLENCKVVDKDSFSTLLDNQTGLILPIYESNVTSQDVIKPHEGKLLQEYVMPINKKWTKGTKIVVIFEVDNEGYLHGHSEIEKDSLDFKLKLHGVKTDDEMRIAAAQVANSSVE